MNGLSKMNEYYRFRGFDGMNRTNGNDFKDSEDKSPRSHKTFLFVLFTGILMIAIGTAFFISVSGQIGYKKVTVSVSRIELYRDEYATKSGHAEPTYWTYVKYTVNGKEYEEEVGIFSDVWVGKKMTLQYDPEDPTQITTVNSIVLPVVIIAGGSVMLIISLIGFVGTRKQRNKS